MPHGVFLGPQGSHAGEAPNPAPGSQLRSPAFSAASVTAVWQWAPNSLGHARAPLSSPQRKNPENTENMLDCLSARGGGPQRPSPLSKDAGRTTFSSGRYWACVAGSPAPSWRGLLRGLTVGCEYPQLQNYPEMSASGATFSCGQCSARADFSQIPTRECLVRMLSSA